MVLCRVSRRFTRVRASSRIAWRSYHAGDFVTDAARAAALAGDIARADRLAHLSFQLGERIAIAQGYNLDRKQTIISVLDDIRAAL